MPKTACLNIALAGDHSLNLHALATLLLHHGGFRVVSISKDTAQLRNSLELAGEEHYPHIVLLDTNFDLYRAEGIISFLKRAHPRVRLAALGLTKDPGAISRLQQMGVHGYIPKNCDPAHLENLLRTLAASIVTPDPTHSADPTHSVDPTHPANPIHPAEPTVTATQRRYFQLTMTEVSDEDIRRNMKLPQSEFGRLVAGLHRQFGVRSSHGLVLALYRSRLMVMDDI